MGKKAREQQPIIGMLWGQLPSWFYYLQQMLLYLKWLRESTQSAARGWKMTDYRSLGRAALWTPARIHRSQKLWLPERQSKEEPECGLKHHLNKYTCRCASSQSWQNNNGGTSKGKWFLLPLLLNRCQLVRWACISSLHSPSRMFQESAPGSLLRPVKISTFITMLFFFYSPYWLL